MATANRFEELEVWQKARVMCKNIYSITNSKSFAQDFGLKDQIRRAAVSVVSNIAEGFERKSMKEFQRFLVIAKGSAGEVRTQLYIGFDLNYIEKETFEVMRNDIEEISKMTKGLISYLNKKDNLI